MRRILSAVLALSLVTACSPAPRPQAKQPLLGLHRVGESVASGPILYRLESVAATRMAGSAGLETLGVVLTARNSSQSTAAVLPKRGGPDEPVLYGSDLTERDSASGGSNTSGWVDAQPQGVVLAFGDSPRTASLRPGGTVKLNEEFVVKRGESGLVLSVALQPGPDIRWLVR